MQNIAFNAAKNIIALADFAEWTTGIGQTLSNNLLTDDQRAIAAAGYSLLNIHHEDGIDVWDTVGQALNIDQVQINMLRQDMQFTDAVTFMAQSSLKDLAALEKTGKLKLTFDKDSVFMKLGKLADREISGASIDTLQAAKIIPDGSVQGNISNYDKARALGGRGPQLEAFNKPPATPIYTSQKDQITAARID